MHRDEDKSGRLDRLLKELHLPTVRRCYQDEAISARRDNWDYETYLYELATRECEVRQNNRIARLLRESKLPLEKSLKAFDRKRLPRKVDAQLICCLRVTFLIIKKMCWHSVIPAVGRLICCVQLPRS